jgi:hypothetical protein
VNLIDTVACYGDEVVLNTTVTSDDGQDEPVQFGMSPDAAMYLCNGLGQAILCAQSHRARMT